MSIEPINFIELEPIFTVCQCCLSNTDLKDMFKTFIHEDTFETYSKMLETCFSIMVQSNSKIKNNNYLICDSCISKLRECYIFRIQIESVQCKLKNMVFPEKKPKGNDNIDSLYLKNDSDDLNINNFNIKNEFISDNHNTNKLNIKNEFLSDDDFSCYFEENISDDTTRNVCVVKKSKQNNNIKKIHSTSVKNNCISTKQKKTKVSSEELKVRIRQYERQKYTNSKPYTLDKSDLTCNVCNETFTSNKILVAHMPLHYPKFICDVCGKYVITKKNLIEHMRSHNTEKIPCQYCDKLLKKTSMLRHVQKHTGENNIYVCSYCPEKFPSYNTRLYHFAIAHGINAKKYKCKICPKSFRFSGGLSSHVKRCHLLQKNIICPECNVGFFTKRELEHHKLKHTKEKNFQCKVCLKSYGRKYTLHEHMKIHNNIKQYKCSLCNREFTQKSTLKCHMKIHEK